MICATLGRGVLQLLLAASVAAALQAETSDEQCGAQGAASCMRATSETSLAQDSAMMQVQVHDVERVHAGLGHRASAGAAVEASSMTSHAVAARAAAEAQAFLANPQNVAFAITKGIYSVHAALPHLTADPPEVLVGMTRLGTGLFDAILTILPEDVKATQAYQDFKSAWDETVHSLPVLVERFAEDIKTFREQGDVSVILRLCSTAVKELGALVSGFLPAEVSVIITKFLGAVEDSVGGFEVALQAFEEGNTTSAVQAIYGGLREASKDLLPPEMQNDETFQVVITAMDTVFRDLSDTMLRFQQHLLQSNVCWKTFNQRERVRPDQCPDTHHYDGEHWCLSVREDGSAVHIKSRYGICLTAGVGSNEGHAEMRNCNATEVSQRWLHHPQDSTVRSLFGSCLTAEKKRWRYRASPQLRVRTCRGGSSSQKWAYTEEAGQLQSAKYADLCVDAGQFTAEGGEVQLYRCSSGSPNQQWDMTQHLNLLETAMGRKKSSPGAIPASCPSDGDYPEQRDAWCYKRCAYGMQAAGPRCKTSCTGDYAVDSPLMCGRSPGMIAAALQEMATRTLKAGLTSAGVSAIAGQASCLQQTIGSLVEIGMGFAHPMCPVLGEE